MKLILNTGAVEDPGVIDLPNDLTRAKKVP